MPLSLNDFIARWQASTRNERSAAQEHFLDLCEALGQARPAELDPTGDFYTFEKGAAKVGGGDGFADVWKRGFFAWEYKGPRRNLDDAYQQLLQYREDLENPPLLVVCDLNRFKVHTNFTGTTKRVYEFTLADLTSTTPTPTSALPPIEVLRALFTEPARLRPDRTTAQVTERAAAEFALLADSLRTRGADPERAAHFLMRLLFCLFAEDISNLLPDHLFSKLIENTRRAEDDFNAQIKQLFAVMSTGGYFGFVKIPHFNGGLFDSDFALDLTRDDLAILARASKLDWSSIEPAIFGTLFERSLDPSKRSQLGAHYTSRDDILLIVEPVLMEPLRRRWAEVQEQAAGILEKRGTTTDRATRTRYSNDLTRVLTDFTDELHAIRVLDPACGSGNFLYVALKRLLDLEKEVSSFAATNGLSGLIPKVDPAQLYGIELNSYAFELASVVVWIGYIQWLNDNGFGVPSSPILQRLDNIKHMDAILTYDADGNPVEPEWAEADVIIGNPPFLGGNRIRQGLGDAYVDALFKLYEGRVPAFADLVCYWFERCWQQLDAGHARRAGLLATQSIRGGVNRRVLERIISSGDIFLAWDDREWILEGATVHVSIVGFSKTQVTSHKLNGVEVTDINADLTSQVNLTVAVRLTENLQVCFIGTKKAGDFDIDQGLATTMLNAPTNVNGRPNSDVVVPWINGQDIVQSSKHKWIIYFGDMPEERSALYEAPFEYVKRHVYAVRQQNNEERARIKWWQHRRPATEMRAATAKLSRYIITPRVSKHRVFAWIPAIVLPDDGTYIFAREDDYFLGVLHSKPHELWARGTGTQLREVESGFRYTPTSTFETYPFPWPPGHEPKDDPRVEAIAEASREIVAKRDAWLNPPGATEAELKKRTLTNLYNERPTWLDMAHTKLDKAVLDAYGWPHDLTDEQILERLLALNLERASGTNGQEAG